MSMHNGPTISDIEKLGYHITGRHCLDDSDIGHYRETRQYDYICEKTDGEYLYEVAFNAHYVADEYVLVDEMPNDKRKMCVDPPTVKITRLCDNASIRARVSPCYQSYEQFETFYEATVQESVEYLQRMRK